MLQEHVYKNSYTHTITLYVLNVHTYISMYVYMDVSFGIYKCVYVFEFEFMVHYKILTHIVNMCTYTQ